MKTKNDLPRYLDTLSPERRAAIFWEGVRVSVPEQAAPVRLPASYFSEERLTRPAFISRTDCELSLKIDQKKNRLIASIRKQPGWVGDAIRDDGESDSLLIESWVEAYKKHRAIVESATNLKFTFKLQKKATKDYTNVTPVLCFTELKDFDFNDDSQWPAAQAWIANHILPAIKAVQQIEKVLRAEQKKAEKSK